MNNNDGEKLIIIRDLNFFYGKKQILKNISLDVERGTILGIIGPNGGGKTTLLKIMLGLLNGYTGEVSLKCILKHSKKKIHHHCIGYVPQEKEINLKFPATIYDMVEMGLYGMVGFFGPSADEKAHVEYLLEEVGIADLRDRHIMEVSGGQLQRALLARALVGNPAILMLDEPLVGIDKSGVINFLELLLRIKKDLELTVVLVTHDFQAVSVCADKVACLKETLHFHDNPSRLKPEILAATYSCGFEAFEALTIQG